MLSVLFPLRPDTRTQHTLEHQGECTDYTLLYYNTLDSTNTHAKRLLQHNQIYALTCIVTPNQTQGRGTRGRSWVSPAGAGWTFSLVQPNIRLNPHYTLATGQALAETLSTLYDITVKLKPVNDIYCNGCKLAGILTESVPDRSGLQPGLVSLITGIGINVQDVPRSLSPHDPERPGVQPVALEQLMPPNAFAQVHFQAFIDAFLPCWLGYQQTLKF